MVDCMGVTKYNHSAINNKKHIDAVYRKDRNTIYVTVCQSNKEELLV